MGQNRSCTTNAALIILELSFSSLTRGNESFNCVKRAEHWACPVTVSIPVNAHRCVFKRESTLGLKACSAHIKNAVKQRVILAIFPSHSRSYWNRNQQIRQIWELIWWQLAESAECVLWLCGRCPCDNLSWPRESPEGNRKWAGRSGH